jgi:hypothetical protein
MNPSKYSEKYINSSQKYLLLTNQDPSKDKTVPVGYIKFLNRQEK